MNRNEKKKHDIDQIFAEGTLIDQALAESVKKALQEHKRAGNPVAGWRDGKVVLLPPDAIQDN